MSNEPARETMHCQSRRDGDATIDLERSQVSAGPSSPVVSPDDPRLASMGREDVAGADQIAGMLAATPDERLDSLVAILRRPAPAGRSHRVPGRSVYGDCVARRHHQVQGSRESGQRPVGSSDAPAPAPTDQGAARVSLSLRPASAQPKPPGRRTGPHGDAIRSECHEQ